MITPETKLVYEISDNLDNSYFNLVTLVAKEQSKNSIPLVMVKPPIKEGSTLKVNLKLELPLNKYLN